MLSEQLWGEVMEHSIMSRASPVYLNRYVAEHEINADISAEHTDTLDILNRHVESRCVQMSH